MSQELLDRYKRRHCDILSPSAVALERLLTSYLQEAPALARIDRVGARAKSPDRFMDKATKNNIDGSPRYLDPMGQIQDQIGARIIVFYKSDVDVVCDRIRKYFTLAEQQLKEPESQWEFGYFGMHFILSLPTDVVPAGVSKYDAPPLFELQIRTLFEHAWSEANHDIVYKSKIGLTKEQIRRCAYTAAQAWGADRIYQELYSELSNVKASQST